MWGYMNKKYIIFIIITLFCLYFSCTENKNNVAVDHSYRASVLLVGVGYNEDMAQTDLNSAYYVFKQGVIYQFNGDDLKLSLNYSNEKIRLSVENLTYARLKKIADNFYVYELPYTGPVNIHGYSVKRISTSIIIKKPVSYMIEMMAGAVMNELGKTHKKDEKGYIYLVGLSYGLSPEKNIIISADMLLTREDQ